MLRFSIVRVYLTCTKTQRIALSLHCGATAGGGNVVAYPRLTLPSATISVFSNTVRLGRYDFLG